MRRFFSRKGTGALLFTICNPFSVVAPAPSFLAPPFSSYRLLPRFLNPSLLTFFGSRCSSSSSNAAAMTGAETLQVEWPAKRVRDTFMNFFEEKNHVNWKSSPVVPVNDPTLLFANAGMILFSTSFVALVVLRGFIVHLLCTSLPSLDTFLIFFWLKFS